MFIQLLTQLKQVMLLKLDFFRHFWIFKLGRWLIRCRHIGFVAWNLTATLVQSDYMIDTWVDALLWFDVQYWFDELSVEHVVCVWLVKVWAAIVLVFFFLLKILLPWVPILLLPFYILKHVLVLRYVDIIRKHFGVLIIKFNDSRHSFDSFINGIWSFKKFTDVVKDQEIFEQRHYIRAFVVDNVVDNLDIIVFPTSQVLLFKVMS